ncbi:hypothetical protein NIES3974_01000 [Calothrix sp. NIES-3974]|nr:hypothetical protein NIES3974_01000 [Calothrix sp. NIES-3974]
MFFAALAEPISIYFLTRHKYGVSERKLDFIYVLALWGLFLVLVFFYLCVIFFNHYSCK